ncbi:MAG: glycogen/starch synthase [Bacteroidales bacterium]|nr:glycogen/starch synthase [Bacteroidales bacterium]MBR4138241.1 glycogen/starch synthase [Bacteroidales bacterium]
MKVLFIHQEITPYLKETPMSLIGRYLPQGIQEKGKEIRIFMPRFGNINERRNQLHEVIRLSGMNMIINDTDHPLIIKVASIQKARIQIYFIDNDDFFTKRKFTVAEKNEIFYEDNDDRTVFFSRGVIETVRKLNWPPDVIHCHGWMSSLVPLYIKRAFKDNPLFSDSKVVYSLYDDDFKESFRDGYDKKLKMPGINAKEIKWLKTPVYANIQKSALDFSDGIVIASPNVNPEVEKYARSLNKPILEYQGEENYVDAYNEFYDKIVKL